MQFSTHITDKVYMQFSTIEYVRTAAVVVMVVVVVVVVVDYCVHSSVGGVYYSCSHLAV